MRWSEYIDHALSCKTAYDDILIGFHGDNRNISPIVKASLVMLEDMRRANDKNSIFVFPSIKNTSFDFILAHVISGITSQGLDSTYDPHLFEKGQKLGFQDCVVVFDHCGINEQSGTEHIWVGFSDGGKLAIPMKYAPFFQKVDSKRLSKYKTFYQKYSKNRELMESGSIDLQGDIIERLKNIKTHLDGTVVFVSEVGKTRDSLREMSLNGVTLTDILYLSHINGDGDFLNISSGQMIGHPAIAVASDLYSVINSIENGASIKEIVFDESVPNSIVKQLDAFDQILQKKISMTCITDTANSFDNKYLIERGFREWRWNNNSITESLYRNERHGVAGRYVQNCSRQKIHYISVDNESLSKATELLYSLKNHIDEQPSNVVKVYNILFDLALRMLKRIIPVEPEIDYYSGLLSDCRSKIEQEARFISEELFEELQSIREWIGKGLTFNNKCSALKEIIEKKHIYSLCIIVSKREGKEEIQQYWRGQYAGNEHGFKKIYVMYPDEYTTCEKAFDAIVVAGWLGSKDMKKVMHCFASAECYVLLYNYENRWRRAHVRTWKQKTNDEGNVEIIKESLSAERIQIDPDDFTHNRADVAYETDETENVEEYTDAGDELETIEELLRQSRYRNYGTSAGTAAELVNAYPISFVGGILAFFREGHKLIVATDIIQQRGDSVKQIIPEDICVGDFVVVREKEAKSDIIRDLADVILGREGKKGIRSIARKWKEPLSVELVFSTPEEVYQRLRDNGCSKDYATVRNWFYDEDMIIPKSKEDLVQIAAVTGDEVLQQKIDIIFEAGKQIRSAHIKAGRELSDRLKREIQSTLKGMDDIDPFNIWDPVSVHVEDIGNIKILKVIDVGSIMSVESSNTNRLFAE